MNKCLFRHSVLECTGESYNPIFLQADTTITGPGRLMVTGGDTGIYMASGLNTLTIRNINVEAACQWGVAGPNGSNIAKLVLDNAGIKAGCAIAAICDFGGGITMKDCAIVYPKDGKISDDGADVVDADGKKAYTVIIEVSKPVDAFRFDDVRDESKFYFTPVNWAYYADPQITNGLSPTIFGYDKICTRGQVVTFLWRAKGCPEPSSTVNPFVDVKDGAFYYKAVLWAVEQGITNGMDPTHFGPDRFRDHPKAFCPGVRQTKSEFPNKKQPLFSKMIEKNGCFFGHLLDSVC